MAWYRPQATANPLTAFTSRLWDAERANAPIRLFKISRFREFMKTEQESFALVFGAEGLWKKETESFEFHYEFSNLKPMPINKEICGRLNLFFSEQGIAFNSVKEKHIDDAVNGPDGRLLFLEIVRQAMNPGGQKVMSGTNPPDKGPGDSLVPVNEEQMQGVGE